MKIRELINLYALDGRIARIIEALDRKSPDRIFLSGLIGSARAILSAAVYQNTPLNHLFILSDKEAAAYFYNDLENLFGEQKLHNSNKRILFFPTTYKRHYQIEQHDNTNLLSRSEVLNRIATGKRSTMIVSYPEALCEKVVSRESLFQNTFSLSKGEQISLDFLADLLIEYEFERVDFVVEPGQFSIRGGIVDLFSFSNDYPYRIEFFGDEIESIRTFNPANQLSIKKLNRITILPDIQSRNQVGQRESLLSYIDDNSVLWFDDLQLFIDKIDLEYNKAGQIFQDPDEKELPESMKNLFVTGKEILKEILSYSVIEFGRANFFDEAENILFTNRPQPSFNKKFDILIKDLNEKKKQGISNIITSDNPKQLERIYRIFEDIQQGDISNPEILFSTLNMSLHEGFVDPDLKIACYTDHQIFNRYHRFHLKDSFSSKEVLTLKEIYNLNPGDFITHIDHGVGRFDGLEKIDNKGRQQEAIRLVYDNNDLLYISIHSLHRISKYVGKEGIPPKLNRLGSNAWNRLKDRTKRKVKDIAKELIKLYAERKSLKGFKFSPDTYLQHELEASFIYEDTPDQLKSTQDVKKDMEAQSPMDRLVCGDVGFGKTEVAIRAAFKAVADSKQVAVLAPTTILTLQHFKTFTERLKDFPCNIDYINRFKSIKAQKQTLQELKSGKIDILIGTHRLVSKDVDFKDLGLLIIDEEQKFGVSKKEKLKQIKTNVDTLTLTATPIPRTLQFSLMGARDFSVINTAPPNRYPIQTELCTLNEKIIRDAINYEISRGGQVYFVHNRVQNIPEVAAMIERFVPGITIGIAHGQMDGHRLEKTMLDFIDGYYDVLLATTIIESGLDIPNVNTIIIDQAQNYGLSDLHQLRGRVGRSNKKAFCYLLTPPRAVLSKEASKRLKAIEEFSELGSGFNIAMRDLDIRGAGNILGAEQSGFISEIGFEMYQKILDEAVQELKINEFTDLFEKERKPEYAKDCQIDTDMELLLPDDYVTNISERLSLYKELDSIETDEELINFQSRIIDRFGPIPRQTDELINTIRLRWLAKKIGLEKIVLKSNQLIGYFVSDQESLYFQSKTFSYIIKYVQDNPRCCQMREKRDKLTIAFQHIRNIHNANEAISPLVET